MLEEQEEQQGIAARIAVRMDWLERCEFCGEIFDPLGGRPDEAEAREVAEEFIGAEEPLKGIEVFRGDADRLAKILVTINDEFGDECHCRRQAASD